MRVIGVHHVQISIPAGRDQEAERFYCGVLGLRKIAKPEALRGRGGFWCEAGESQVHIGTGPEHEIPSSKAHVAYEVDEISEWIERISEAGCEISSSVEIPGFSRFEFRDPFGNRVEIIQRIQEEER